jgi:serine/threonine-protein kinase
MMGTPEYMAPEQAYAADSVDVRADVYSVGAILYEMLAGTRPAEGDDPLEIAAFIMGQKVRRLSQVDRTIPERLSDIVHRAMAPMPADRFTTVSELRAALTPLSGSVPPAPGASHGRGVPATLPPDAGQPPQRTPAATGPSHATPRGTTQAGTDGPRVARSATPNFTPPAYALPPPPGANPYAPGIPGPGGYANLPTVPTSPGKRPRRLSVWLLIGMSVLAIAIVAGAIAMGELEGPTPRPEATTAPPAPSIPTAQPTAIPTGAAPAALPPIGTPVQPPTAVTPPTTSAKTPSKPHPASDAGTSAQDAAPPPGLPTIPGIPFPIPSTLPIPQIPITLPSGFPSFPFPGMPGAPAPTSSH